MNKFECREIQKKDFPEWDKLIESSSHGTIYHTSGWLQICAKYTGKRLKIYGCYKGNHLVGGCSFFIERLWGIVPVAVSTSDLTKFGGFVILPFPGSELNKKESFSRQVIQSLLDYIKEDHFFFICAENSPEFTDIRPFKWNGWKSEVNYAYVCDLTLNIESQINKRTLNSIKKSEQIPLIVEPSTDISSFYSLLFDTLTRKKAKLPSKHLLTELFSFIRDQKRGELLICRTTENEIVAGEIAIWDTKTAYGWMGASDKQFLNSGASSFLRFQMLKKLQERGIPKYNMGGGNIPELSNYMSKFNPTIVPYYQIQYRNPILYLSFDKILTSVINKKVFSRSEDEA
jgi:hypothetical protein